MTVKRSKYSVKPPTELRVSCAMSVEGNFVPNLHTHPTCTVKRYPEMNVSCRERMVVRPLSFAWITGKVMDSMSAISVDD